MEILQNLNGVREFTFAETLRAFLVDKLRLSPPASAPDSFAKFLETTIMIVESSVCDSEAKFTESVKHLANRRGRQKQTISELIRAHLASATGDLVEIKGLNQPPGQFVEFNITSKILVSKNFECLLEMVGEGALNEIIQRTILLYKHEDIYVQIIGRSLQSFFEVKKAPQGQRQAGRRDKTEGNGKQILAQEVDRNVFLYCLHKNKDPDFFHNSVLYQLKKEAKKAAKNAEPINPRAPPMTASLASKLPKDAIKGLFDHVFGKESIDSETRAELTKLLTTTAKNYIKINMKKLYNHCCPLQYAKFKSTQNALQKLKERIKKPDVGLNLAEKLKADFQANFSVLTNMTLPEAQVILFIKTVFNSMFPAQLYGVANKPIMLWFIKRLVTMKRFEAFTLADVFNRMDTRHFDWFRRKFTQQHLKEVHGSRVNLFAKILRFIFETMLSLIKSTFYVTERHNEHNQLFYYSKSVWLLLSQFAQMHLELENLVKVENLSWKGGNSLIERPIGKLRFVPKGDSVRPIMTFHKRFRDARLNKLVRIATYLNPIKVVLRSVKYALAERCGYSVFDNHQIFARLEEFVTRWRAKGEPDLFCVSMDISKCYDSVDLDRMFDFIRQERTFQEVYFLNNFFKIIRNKRFCFRKGKAEKQALASLFHGKRRDGSNEMLDLLDLKRYFKDKIVHSNKTIFLDSGVKYLITKDDILERLGFICSKVFIRFGKSYYRLKRGLPQGLSVSGVLSSFYYSMLEDQATRHLKAQMEARGDLILVMRMTDDYLIVADRRENAMAMVNALISCSKDNGFEFNQKKFRANFHTGRYFQPTGEVHDFRWIGKTFSFPKFEVEHVQVLNRQEAFYTVNTNLPAGLRGLSDFLKGKFKTFFLNQNTFYFNKIVNSDEKVMSIIPRVTESSFYKLNAYLCHLSPLLHRSVLKRESRFVARKLVETIVDCACLVSNLSRNLRRMTVAKCILETVNKLLSQDRNTKFKQHLWEALVDHAKTLSESHYLFIK